MLYLMCMGFAELSKREKRKQFKMKKKVFSGTWNLISDVSLKPYVQDTFSKRMYNIIMIKAYLKRIVRDSCIYGCL